MPKDPYLADGRLNDVIAAITALGAYRYYKLTFPQWAERISDQPGEADRWERIFREHPEFFRVNNETRKASLVWRRQNPRAFDPRFLKELSREDYDKLSSTDREKLGRRPLDASEVTSLISVAVQLHDSALEKHKAGKWWVPIATSAFAFMGALIGTWLGVQGWSP